MKAWTRSIVVLCLLSFPGIGRGAEKPRLSITNEQGNFVVSWPGAATNWVLEESARPEWPAAWLRVGAEFYQSNGAARLVRGATAGTNRFYRLRKQGLSVPGLTGYWQLDEGAGQFAEDGSAGAAVLSLANVTWAAGRLGPGSLHFNGAAGAAGSQAWVSNQNFQVLPPAGRPFSVSHWFSPDALPLGTNGLLGTDAGDANGWQVALQTTGPGTNLLVFAGAGAAGSLSVTGRSLLLPGQWHQLTITHDGAQGSLYLDSIRLAQGLGSVPAHQGALRVGGGVGGLDSFLGRIDEVRTYTNCLSWEEISLAGHWRFNENAGTMAGDSSIQGHAASLSAAGAWGEGHEGTGADLGAGQVMIGNGDYSILPASGGAFSISCWVRPRSLEAGRSGLMNCGGGTNGWELWVEHFATNADWLHFDSTNSGGTLSLSAPVGLTNGVWTKLDATFNGGIATLYANGRNLKSGNGAIRGTKGPLLVGTGFNGLLDDLKIYNRDRDEAEIGPVARTMWETVFRGASTNIVLQGFGPAGRTLTYALTGPLTPTNGTAELSAGSPVVTYLAGGAKGPDTFTYTVSDGEFTTPPTIVAMSVVEPHWLSPGGGVGSPQDGTSAERAWTAGGASALDAIWKTNNFYDCFFYTPGEFQTTGWKYQERSTANPGCKHVGSGPSGAGGTTIKLVDIGTPWAEEVIFGRSSPIAMVDGFEIHQLTLDCNADNVPKYSRGEPVWIRIPLNGTSRVDTVTLRWDSKYYFGGAVSWIGRAAEFTLCARRFATNTWSTNCQSRGSAGQVDVVNVGAEADELILQLNLRDAGVGYYGLLEVEVAGVPVSLPTATLPAGGDSRLDPQHDITALADGNPATAWASGPGNQVLVTFPLAAGTALTGVSLTWNCQTMANQLRLGPAADYSIRARDENTGQHYDVPLVRHPRGVGTPEVITFGTTQSTNSLVTDQLVLVLNAKEAGVDFYSLQEVSLQHGLASVPMRLPQALNNLTGSILRAFDRNPATEWASATQGMVGAVNVAGSNMKFTHLKVKGFGTKAGRECFPMFITTLNAAASRGRALAWGNVLVEDCIFTEPATNNGDGITVLELQTGTPDQLTNAVIRRCSILDIKPWFSYSHAIKAAQVEDCLVDNCGDGLYWEPNLADGYSVGPALIRSNRFLNVLIGLSFLSHPAGPFDGVTFVGNEIVLAEGGTFGFRWGVAGCDICYGGQGGWITNATILGNVIRYPGWGARPGNLDGGIFYIDMHHAVIGNNVIVLGNGNDLRVRQCPSNPIYPYVAPEDCDHPAQPPAPPYYLPCLDTLKPGYRRAWFNNRKLDSSLLEVRFINFGIDGPAAQQQWPE